MLIWEPLGCLQLQLSPLLAIGPRLSVAQHLLETNDSRQTPQLATIPASKELRVASEGIHVASDGTHVATAGLHVVTGQHACAVTLHSCSSLAFAEDEARSGLATLCKLQ